MGVSLRPVNKDNYEVICDLDVSAEQEDYVACNMWSLVESFYNEEHYPRGIYKDEAAVGFIMWQRESEHKVSLFRFMIDKSQQNQGIGRKALTLALAQIKQLPGLKEIEICYNPNNPVAKDFYASFGFVETGMDEDDEDMLAVITL